MLEEYNQSNVTFVVNGKFVTCPKFVMVNGKFVPGSYGIQDGDNVETRSFYTVAQVAEFMDVEIDADKEIFVNNRSADFDTLVYENFTIEWTSVSFGAIEETEKIAESNGEPENNEEVLKNNTAEISQNNEEVELLVYVNKAPVVLTGKKSYIFVDVFDFISFDLNAGNGRAIETLMNGRKAQFTEPLSMGDKIELFWKEN